ncbi:MAG: hypothetical protein NZM39_12425, partial [Bernardetiaceae bacterium]|nr:hypothetical protein [Bernardetiaceae bacterium]
TAVFKDANNGIFPAVARVLTRNKNTNNDIMVVRGDTNNGKGSFSLRRCACPHAQQVYQHRQWLFVETRTTAVFKDANNGIFPAVARVRTRHKNQFS